MATWIPVLVSVLTVILGAITYLFQKRRDRFEDLIKTRRSEYRKWIQNLYNILATDKPNALLDFNMSTNDLFLFASDAVMLAVGEFKKYMSKTSPGGEERNMKTVGALLANVVEQMRNDCFEKTNLPNTAIREILPIQG